VSTILEGSTEERAGPGFQFGVDPFIPVTVDYSGRPVGGDQVIRHGAVAFGVTSAAGHQVRLGGCRDLERPVSETE
jgi:hypothetical protein